MAVTYHDRDPDEEIAPDHQRLRGASAGAADHNDWPARLIIVMNAMMRAEVQ